MRITTLTGTYLLSLCSCIALAFVLPAIEQSTVAAPPSGLVAGVAIGGAVQPTAENTLYDQLQRERAILEQRSRQLDAQQNYLSSRNKNQQLILYILIAILFCLVTTNFYLDKRREKLFARH